VIDVEWIKDEAVSVFPEGVPVEAVPEFAELIVRLVEIAQMKYVLVNGKWVNPHGVVAAPPAVSGCKEIADAGTMCVNTYSARPKPGDLKPSESMLRDMKAKAEAPLLAQRAEYRARLAELDRELANGRTEVHPEATPGNAVSVPGENGRRMIVPEERLTPGDRARVEQEQVARVEAYARPAKLEPVESGKDGATAEERLRVAAARAKMAATPQPTVSFVDKIPEGAEVLHGTPDYNAPKMADFESWDMASVGAIPKGR
jgi:hypothetical protein